MQGDGAVSLNVSPTQASATATTDGNDYMEGGGGGDLMFGNLGQDDLIGGSSNLFGLTTTAARPDGADVIYGGAGLDAARNALGDTTPGGHARDADVIMGDNANVYRILSGNAASAYASFNYDDYAGGLRIIPRAVDLLDYSADGNNDTGAGDELHGESGDDSVHGMSGNDYALGDGQDDHVFGESGDDWLDGGAGDDAMLGDDGKILTSRNGKAEPLYGLTASAQRSATVNSIKYTVPLYVTGQLLHIADLEPFDIGGADVMYGGLGNDAMHGGAGQDLMSGAEALPEFFKPAVIPTLAFAAEKFEAFDYNNPLVRIVGHPLNFEAFTGTPENIINDGNDALFGDSGNDWLVGGTQTDRLYGGYGNDVLNTDDNLDTNAGANSAPDAAPYEGADLAFGGAGRDIFVGNAPTDRLIDWVGEFNNYYVPFNPFGQSTLVRQISQQIVDFLYIVSRSDGADRTRVGPGLGTAARNGEPFGELGLVTPQDADWNAQNGPPVGPQPQ
jgi:Ca2+-binding RTX toxin-like protein